MESTISATDAIRLNDTPALKVIIADGLDVNMWDIQGATLLARAVQWNRSHAAQLLLDCGADPNGFSSNGLTPMMRARTKEMAELLVQYGATQDMPSRTSSRFPYSDETALIVQTRAGNLEVVQFLVSIGADIAHRASHGKSAIEIAEELSERRNRDAIGDCLKRA